MVHLGGRWRGGFCFFLTRPTKPYLPLTARNLLCGCIWQRPPSYKSRGNTRSTPPSLRCFSHPLLEAWSWEPGFPWIIHGSTFFLRPIVHGADGLKRCRRWCYRIGYRSPSFSIWNHLLSRTSPSSALVTPWPWSSSSNHVSFHQVSFRESSSRHWTRSHCPPPWHWGRIPWQITTSRGRRTRRWKPRAWREWCLVSPQFARSYQGGHCSGGSRQFWTWGGLKM